MAYYKPICLISVTQLTLSFRLHTAWKKFYDSMVCRVTSKSCPTAWTCAISIRQSHSHAQILGLPIWIYCSYMQDDLRLKRILSFLSGRLQALHRSFPICIC